MTNALDRLQGRSKVTSRPVYGSELRNCGLTSLIWVDLGIWYMRICLCIVVIDNSMLFLWGWVVQGGRYRSIWGIMILKENEWYNDIMNTEIGGDIISHSFIHFPPLVILLVIYILYIYYTSYTHNTMRQLKHHEQKLLKKVDFLSVSHIPCWAMVEADQIFSGNKMRHIERSRSWESTIFKIERIITSMSIPSMLFKSWW